MYLLVALLKIFSKNAKKANFLKLLECLFVKARPAMVAVLLFEDARPYKLFKLSDMNTISLLSMLSLQISLQVQYYRSTVHVYE